MDRGAWKAAVRGVAEGRTRLERLHFHFSLSCTGEGNGNPLQCSCLENPRDGRAWWAAVYGVTQSQILLKRLSSSSSGKEPACQCRRPKRLGFNPWVRKIPWRRAWQFTPIFMPGESHRCRGALWTVDGVTERWTKTEQLTNKQEQELPVI